MYRRTGSILTLAFSQLDQQDELNTVFLFTQEVADDILYIQSQNQGLQVQTQNQRALLSEIANLLVRRPSAPPFSSVTDHFCTR